jgi:hypothetical protein
MAKITPQYNDKIQVGERFYPVIGSPDIHSDLNENTVIVIVEGQPKAFRVDKLVSVGETGKTKTWRLVPNE